MVCSLALSSVVSWVRSGRSSSKALLSVALLNIGKRRMLIEVKKGVFIKEINDHFITVCGVVSKVYYDHENVVPTLTSAADGQHLDASYHYVGLAWDFRTHNLMRPELIAGIISDQLREVDPCYDVVYGDPHHIDHIHIEWDRRRAERLKREEVK